MSISKFQLKKPVLMINHNKLLSAPFRAFNRASNKSIWDIKHKWHCRLIATFQLRKDTLHTINTSYESQIRCKWYLVCAILERSITMDEYATCIFHIWIQIYLLDLCVIFLVSKIHEMVLKTSQHHCMVDPKIFIL